MSLQKAKQTLYDHIWAKHPLLSVVTEDEYAVIDTVKKIAANTIPYHIWSFRPYAGRFVEYPGSGHKVAENIEATLSAFLNHPHPTILVLHDISTLLNRQPELVFFLKETTLHIDICRKWTAEGDLQRYRQYEGATKHIIITSTTSHLPQELERIATVLSFPLPDREDATKIFRSFIANEQRIDEESGIAFRPYTREEQHAIINSALGLTEYEMLHAFKKSIFSSHKRVVSSIVQQEKIQIIKKDGSLSYIEHTLNLDSVGGLDMVRDWIQKRTFAFDPAEQKKWNLNPPKGLLLTGVQGCGKSHIAKAIAGHFSFPFLRLDMGALMNKWVGESEANIRKVIAVAESIAPVVLFIDEIDKVIPNPRNNNTHEVTNRIFSTLLTWMQEKTAPVFLVATANHIDHLPPELLRKGRFDEVFFVDLPNEAERLSILSLHLRRKTNNLSSFSLERVAAATKGFSGAEIEALVEESNLHAACNKVPLTTKHLLEACSNTTPLSVTFAEKIQALRTWAKENHVRPAQRREK